MAAFDTWGGLGRIELRTAVFGALIVILGLSPSAIGQNQPAAKRLEQVYQSDIRPLLKRYCHECHAGDDAEAEIDFAAFEKLADARRQPKVWQSVRRMLDSRQMPPKEEKRQPTDAERTKLRMWVRAFLTAEAKAHAGDPGPVVLRRLSNAEYTYTVRDLTGVVSLDPTREFPIDGAAGEGFTNTGGALSMSPSLVRKYLDAGKGIARHAMLLPEGIRFSPHVTRRDRTDALLGEIRTLYRQYTVAENQDGRIPLGSYIAATLEERDALTAGKKTIDAVARQRGLSAKYLGTLWRMFTAKGKPSLLLDPLRTRWRAAGAKDAAALTAEIAQRQKALWKFNTIGHIGREGGPPSWQQAVTPVASRRQFKLPLPKPADGKDIVIYLSASDAGDGGKGDYVLWKSPRLEGGGHPVLLLRDVAGYAERLTAVRREALQKTSAYLAAVAAADEKTSVADLAARHRLDPGLLKTWLAYLDVKASQPVAVQGHFTQKMLKSGNYDFIQGWGSGATPSVSANSSDQQVTIPGTARPHGVVAHPSPTLFAAMGWQSPLDGVVRVEARVADAHFACGNGVEWVVQHRTSAKAGNLWQGEFDVRGKATMPAATIAVRKGELISLILGPRKGSHVCDLTAVDMTITETSGKKRVWDLGKDVSGNILQANPHADRYGNQRVWHFYKGLMKDVNKTQGQVVAIPQGSLLAAWQAEKDAGKRRALAARVQTLATSAPPADANSPDALLFQQLQTLAIPLDRAALLKGVKPDPRFGKHPLGHAIDGRDLAVQAPAVLELRIPAALAADRSLVVTGQLDPKHGRDGSVQLSVSVVKSADRNPSLAAPIIAGDGSEARRRVESALKDFRDLFPIAMCYERIVPVDEVVTLTLFYREDVYLRRLMLSDQQTARLDRLWDELYFVSREPLELVTAFEQISEFATQDRPDLVKALKVLKKPIHDRADAFRRRLIEAEPSHVTAVVKFAGRAWRRKLTQGERRQLRGLYQELRKAEMPHDEAIRLTLARVLTSPAFLYRREQPAPGKKSAPVSNTELATRLSYFLWSSIPDESLRRIAEAGRLTDEKTLLAETGRMLDDDRTRRLAIHFACQWLHVRNFDENDDKNEKLYPQFARLRSEMYEETVRFFEHMFRKDGSILDLLAADHTFLNESLAKHYGIAGVSGKQWRRIDGVRKSGRGGVLAMATVLASQSGASRTSPILRGNWVYETLLGERLPRPPANVPQLPDEAPPRGLTARQLIEKHSSAPACAKCHEKIDPYGFALEQYDAIGRLRPKAVNTKTKLPDGTTIEGIDGLRRYLLGPRRDDVVGQFCRKLLGYALGREVQLSDEPLLAEMKKQLAANDYRFSVAVTMIVASRQFREMRGRDFGYD
ncbi:MAG: DUF1592 domain-containing protein [Planctomycetes bacterium]|nr:DUF1592 domain-containing protein [Planctomycetota bacterium]